MHIALSKDEMRQNFNVWVYGKRHSLVRGSVLFVAETGITADHHFLMTKGRNFFQFTQGRYQLQVFAHLLGDKRPTHLFES